MDEITLLTAVRPAAPRLDSADREAARDRLLAAAAGESAGQAGTARPAPRLRVLRRPGLAPRPGLMSRPGTPRPGTPRPGTPRPASPARRPGGVRSPGIRQPAGRLRLGIGMAAAAAVIACGAVGLAALPATGTVPAGATGPAGTAVPGGPAGHGRAPATASAVLLLAAHAAAATPSNGPGPSQFVFTEQTQVRVRARVTPAGRLHRLGIERELQRSWLSADGKHGQLVTQRLLPGGKWSRSPLTSLGCYPGSRQSACPQGYLGHLPGTVRGMRRFLLRNGWHPSGTAAFGIISGIENVSWERGLLVPNRSYALMFRAAAHAPGIFLIPHAVDVAGRPGIGVAVCVPPGPGRVLGNAKGVTTRPPGCQARIELIFSARTYELIGEQNAGPGGRPLHGQGAAALLRTAVVSRLGQLP